jgi:2,3-bisphosphoglycerate-dependent phosphoglycerate mutase
MKGQLILLRHGQSIWNLQNRFTGWVDVPLSKKGIEEAVHAGRMMANCVFDAIFMSNLERSHQTTFLAMAENGSQKALVVQDSQENAKIYDDELLILPVYKAWQLNERMYGHLQGLNKDAMRKKYGNEQVAIWRRSYAISPPGGESLKETVLRVMPYFKEKIEPLIQEGKTILVSAHGNSLRAIMMQLEQLSQEEIVKLEIPTGEPISYQYKKGTFSREK